MLAGALHVPLLATTRKPLDDDSEQDINDDEKSLLESATNMMIMMPLFYKCVGLIRDSNM